MAYLFEQMAAFTWYACIVVTSVEYDMDEWENFYSETLIYLTINLIKHN